MSILRQVEYYFSDSSFPFDDFLKKLASEEGKDGFVDLSVIMGPCPNPLDSSRRQVILNFQLVEHEAIKP